MFANAMHNSQLTVNKNAKMWPTKTDFQNTNFGSSLAAHGNQRTNSLNSTLTLGLKKALPRPHIRQLGKHFGE